METDVLHRVCGLRLCGVRSHFFRQRSAPGGGLRGVCCGTGTAALGAIVSEEAPETKFLNAFADGVDVIVRGIKAGLPLVRFHQDDYQQSPEPLRSEFRAILDTQAIGMPIGEACLKLYERIPLPETNFFGIVVSIQQKSGGNLSEALGNLSHVLRDRKKMKAKIQAMSQEAKASAGIIGALPPVVAVLVYVVSPDYISLLWETRTGQICLAASAIWMTVGIMTMRKMINFDF